ncbi:MAG TPA: hypothetical protein VD978_20465 [Azospirillum sp.]|nr:hypothetical protein [Azospirillum sp.]
MRPSMTWRFETPRRVFLEGRGRQVELRFVADAAGEGWDVLVNGRRMARCPELSGAQERAMMLVAGCALFPNAAEPDGELSYEALLKPILTVPPGDEAALDRAVNAVAEELAVLGALMVDRDERPAYGVTDEEAVLGTLAVFGRTLLRQGEFDDALGVADLMERVEERGKTRRARRAA